MMRSRVIRWLLSITAVTVVVYGLLFFTSKTFYEKHAVLLERGTSALRRNLSSNNLIGYLEEDYKDSATTVDHSASHRSEESQRGNPNEKHHVALLKVHKTGSSTVQNIFLRFADSRNLTLIMAHDNKSLSENGYANVISYSNTLLDSNIVPPPAGRHFDMLCCHVIYNRTQFRKYLPEDTAYVGIVRNPFTRTESAIRYFHMLNNVTLSSFAADPMAYDKGSHSMINNRMAFEFNVPLELFPNMGDNYNHHDTLQSKIEEALYNLGEDFDIILVSEYMAESLVLMKRLLNWELKDIVYVNLNVAKSETQRFSDMDKLKLEPFLYLDMALYEFAIEKLQASIEEAGDDFKGEVQQFLKVKDLIKAYCTASQSVDVFTIEASPWNKPFTVTKKDCDLYAIFETRYIQQLRMRQYGKLNN